MKKLIMTAVLAGLIALAAAPAMAHVGHSFALRLQDSDTGSAQWQYNRVDSPADADKGRLKLAVALQDGDDYALAWADGTGIRGKAVEAVRNLSFDFLSTTYVGAGAPRISVDVDTTGDGTADVYAYLSALYCQEAYSGSDWSRADFTGRTAAGCSIYASDGGPYTSDGTSSAWAVFAAAHRGATVLDAYVVMDEVGQSFIDRLAFQRHMFTRAGHGPASIKECPTESAC